MWPGVALHGDHLRLPWPDVARRRLVPARLGSPPGSQSSLAPLIFDGKSAGSWHPSATSSIGDRIDSALGQES
jgi:hypothetical protein